MKALSFRVCILGMALSPLMFCVGCEEEVANAEVIPPNTDAPVHVVAVDDPKKEAAPAEAPAPANPQAKPNVEDPAKAPPPAVVQNAAPPKSLKLSAALEEITKMIQAGVSDEVLSVYIANSTNLFNIGADELVYLNDLGVSSQVMTAMIQHDVSPEIIALRKAATAATPLPPGVALSQPATNIYPSTTPPAPPPSVPPDASVPPAEGAAATASYATADYGPQQQVSNVSYFYDELAPYGNWVQLEGYGLCWQPTVAVYNSYWRPYSDNGRWLWSDAGWYWHSGYSWGWAPFHYGRWCTYPSLGWVWRPDTCWGPSWVTWRYTPYYCGWAPLPPSCQYVSGFGLHYQNGSVGLSFGFGFGADCYTFVPLNRFCDRNPHHYYTTLDHARALYKDSTVVNNYVVGNNNTIINEGIGRERVARVTRSDIPKVSIRTTPLGKDPTRRAERLERDGAQLTLVRPTLPKEPPIKPALVTSRTHAEVRKDGRITEPFRRPATTALRPDSLRGSEAALVSKPGSPTTGGGEASATAGKSASEASRTTRPASIVITGKKTSEGSKVSSTPIVASTTTRTTAPNPGAANTASRAASAPTERSVSGSPPTRSQSSAGAGSVRPTAPVTAPQRTATAASSSYVGRPDTYRVYSEPPKAAAPQTAPRPAPPRLVAPSGNPFLGGSSSAASSRPAYVAPSAGPAPSARSTAPAPAPRVYSAPATPVHRPTYSAPAHSAPASRPTAPAPAQSSSGGGAGRSGRSAGGK